MAEQRSTIAEQQRKIEELSDAAKINAGLIRRAEESAQKAAAADEAKGAADEIQALRMVIEELTAELTADSDTTGLYFDVKPNQIDG